MTHIHEVQEDSVVLPVPNNANAGGGVLRYAIYGVTVLIAGFNVVASINLYQATAEMKVLDQKLSELSAFEKRILQKIDIMNTGVHGQFDLINNKIQATLKTAPTYVSERSLNSGDQYDDPPAWKQLTTRNLQKNYSEFILVNNATDAQSERSAVAFKENKESSYERIVSSDGKIYYKKIY